jgi:hypothetical protein
MTRRTLFAPIVTAVALPARARQERSSIARTILRGRLDQREGQPTRLATPRGPVALSGDEPTVGVLNDPRLANADFEVSGLMTANGLEIDPIHTRSLFAYQDGRRLMVTYWCDICYIRTYTPGVCWCCQDWTRLDLKDPDTPDPKP